jgi:hypothetical protein
LNQFDLVYRNCRIQHVSHMVLMVRNLVQA